jgi:hypothetical protein
MPSAAPSRTAWARALQDVGVVVAPEFTERGAVEPRAYVGLRIDRDCPAAALPVSSVLDQETAADGKYRLRGKGTRSGGEAKTSVSVERNPARLGWLLYASRRRPQEQSVVEILAVIPAEAVIEKHGRHRSVEVND